MEKTVQKFLPYGRQHVFPEDIDLVAEVLRSDWLTQGPVIPRFEHELAEKVGAREAVACASGTAALHLAMMALGVHEGDAVVTSPITFLSDANCARFVGARVLFADIDPATGCMSPEALTEVLNQDSGRDIKAVIPVHFAGQPADLPHIHELASAHGAVVVDDACHALGASYEDGGNTCVPGGSPHAAMTVYSFHPVKHVAMGEGGAVATDDETLAARLRLCRNHGMTKKVFENTEMSVSTQGEVNPWYYEMQEIGYNYRLTDIQAALGLSQLKRLDWSVKKRNEIAAMYRALISERFAADMVRPLAVRKHVRHAYHLFVVQIDFDHFGVSRGTVMRRLREAGIGTQVHYIPVHLQPYHRRHCGTAPGDFAQAESYYARALSLPMYPDLTENDLVRVTDELNTALTQP
jgi:UDP-4-amino-4,6-dideoxy-N-acetyl-beta-L-altrosamine transaminase